MTVARLQDRLEDTISGVLKVRAAPDDVVEWSISASTLVFPCEDGGHHSEVVVTLWMCLGEPDSPERRMAHVLIPMTHLDPATLVSWANQMWDNLEFLRLSDGLEVETGESG